MINGVMQQITINNTKWGGCTNFISCNNQIRNVNSSFLQCNQNSVLTFRSPNRCRCNDRCSAARYATAKGGKSVITGSVPSEKKKCKFNYTSEPKVLEQFLQRKGASGNGKKVCVMCYAQVQKNSEPSHVSVDTHECHHCCKQNKNWKLNLRCFCHFESIVFGLLFLAIMVLG